MGTVIKLKDTEEDMTVSDAVERFLAHVAVTRARKTARNYRITLGAFADVFGELDISDLDLDHVGQWFEKKWGQGSAQGWNRNRAALASAASWWRSQPDIPVSGDPFARIGRRPVPPDRSRALSRDSIDKLISNHRVPLRERAFWAMLYSTAARSAEVLALNVQDLDMANSRATVKRKGGASDIIWWNPRTHRLLTGYLAGRTRGPLFVTSRKGKSDANLGPGDLDPEGRGRLSVDQAEQLFKKSSGGATLHQLRHSALTHMAEEGASAPMLMTKSGHTSLRTLGKYARPSADAVAAWEAEHDRNGRGDH